MRNPSTTLSLLCLAGLVTVTGTSAAEAAPSSTASSSASAAAPSGEEMPSGTLDGWEEVYAQDFTDDAPAGSFRSTYPDIDDYGDATPDTSGNGCYDNGENVSAHDGLVDVHLRTIDGCPSGGVIAPNNQTSQTYGRYTVRYRADAAEGYGSAFLLWPASNDWKEGEIDFPESPFTDPQYMVSFELGTEGTVAYKNHTDVSWQDWHTATTEWTPDSLKFFIDGEKVGETTDGVPQTPFKWVVQAATNGADVPDASVEGHLQIDWMVYSKQA
ncbi:glycoside hydrolase family 16 protein [Kineococcus sp. SYSU DK003]|uniref:glycoside hydrolase family 16 protein n=1 Tax=Kineococcus sp. SYSU DK003 TaxID=3383124 RepID=UPI003D7F0832